MISRQQSTTPGLDEAKALRYDDAGGLANSSTSLHHIPQPILMFGGEWRVLNSNL